MSEREGQQWWSFCHSQGHQHWVTKLVIQLCGDEQLTDFLWHVFTVVIYLWMFIMKQKYNLLKAFKDSWAGPGPLTWCMKLYLHSCQDYCVNAHCFLSLGDRLLWVDNRRMRRSGAPSQLLGNAVKKPRFMPPGACTAAESKPLTPKFGLGNALQKVNFFFYSISSAVLSLMHTFDSDRPALFQSSSSHSLFLLSCRFSEV